MKAERLRAHHEGIAAPYAIMRLHGFLLHRRAASCCRSIRNGSRAGEGEQ